MIHVIKATSTPSPQRNTTFSQFYNSKTMKLFTTIVLLAGVLIGSTVSFEDELNDEPHHHVRSRELLVGNINKAKVFSKYLSINDRCCGADLSNCNCPVRTISFFGTDTYPKSKWESSCKTTIPMKLSVGGYVLSNKDLSTLAGLLKDANLLSNLLTNSNNGLGYTLFAPTNAAFAKLPSSPSSDKVKNILLYHVVPGTLKSNELAPGPLTTLSGKTISVSVDASNGVTLNDGSEVTIPDNRASNGIVHGIDTVLFPPQ